MNNASFANFDSDFIIMHVLDIRTLRWIWLPNWLWTCSEFYFKNTEFFALILNTYMFIQHSILTFLGVCGCPFILPSSVVAPDKLKDLSWAHSARHILNDTMAYLNSHLPYFFFFFGKIEKAFKIFYKALSTEMNANLTNLNLTQQYIAAGEPPQSRKTVLDWQSMATRRALKRFIFLQVEIAKRLFFSCKTRNNFSNVRFSNKL